LSHDSPEVIREGTNSQLSVKLIGFAPAFFNGVIKRFLIGDGWVFGRLLGGNLAPHHDASAIARDVLEDIVPSSLGTVIGGVDVRALLTTRETRWTLRRSAWSSETTPFSMAISKIRLLGLYRTMGRDDVVVEPVFGIAVFVTPSP
jgi:hypothetical protein